MRTFRLRKKPLLAFMTPQKNKPVLQQLPLVNHFDDSRTSANLTLKKKSGGSVNGKMSRPKSQDIRQSSLPLGMLRFRSWEKRSLSAGGASWFFPLAKWANPN